MRTNSTDLENAFADSMFCKILVGLAVTLTLIIMTVLMIQLSGINFIDIEKLTIALASGSIGVVIGISIPNLFKNKK